MVGIIIYTISIFCFYLIFFRIKYRTRESYRWVDKGKATFPVWVWFVGLIVLLTPVLNIAMYLSITAVTVCGGFDGSDNQFVLGENFKKFMNKRY